MKIPNFKPDKLANDLVTLIPMQDNDFERLFAVAADPLIWEQHPAKDRYKREVFQGFFDGAVQQGTSFLVFDTATQKLIGSTRYYDFDAGKSRIAIGYTFLAKEFWGGNYNQSMKKLLIDYAFQYVKTVVFHVGADNIRSQKAVTKIGGQKVAEINIGSSPHFEYHLNRYEL